MLSRDPGDVIGLIEAVLPLDEERREDWKIWFAFWSEALSQPKYATEQSERARTTRERIRKCLSVRQQRGDIAANADIAAASDRLSVLIPGIASSAIFDPKTWTPTRQRTTLRNELLLIGLT